MFLSVQDHVSESTIKRILHKKKKKNSLTCSTKTNDCKWINQTETSGLLLAEQKTDCKWYLETHNI
jgi:hypothetical protein